jgi:hypothetical protein
MILGFVARSKVNAVVNRKLEIIRVPILLHQMSIQTQRAWCRRNGVDFFLPRRKSLAKPLVKCVA